MLVLAAMMPVVLIGCGVESDDEDSRREPPPQTDGRGDGTTDGQPADVGCRPFTVVLTSGCSATRIDFWPASGSALLERVTTPAEQSAGLTLSSPSRACSATFEWPGRWDAWVDRRFPGSNAPSGYCLLEGGARVPFGELEEGEGAYGCAHDGRTKYGAPPPCAGGSSNCYAAR